MVSRIGFLRVAFWLLLPATAVQGLWLRRVAIRLPGAPGERQGDIGSGEVMHLLALGDSIIEGVGTNNVRDSLPVQFARVLSEQSGKCIHWRIEGQSGFDIDDVLERLNSLEQLPAPHFVLLSVGVNDVTGLSTTRHWRSKVKELLQTLCRRWPGTQIIFTGLPPMAEFPLPPQPLRFSLGLRAATLDSIAAMEISNIPNANHIPTRINPGEHGFCEDGFHPSAESCNLWAEQLLLDQGENNHE